MVASVILSGMKEISEFVRFSESTVAKHKKSYPGMPIRKEGGVWLADPDTLRRFYKDLAKGDTEKYLEEPEPEAEEKTTASIKGGKRKAQI